MQWILESLVAVLYYISAKTSLLVLLIVVPYTTSLPIAGLNDQRARVALA